MKPLCTAVVSSVMMFAIALPANADDAEKLLGKWEITKSGGEAPVGTIVEFQKEGKINATVTFDGKEVKLTGMYKFDGKKLKISLKVDDEKIENEYTVKFKGDDEMTLENEDKNVDTLKRKK